MMKSDQARKKRLVALIERMQSGKDIAVRDLKNVLLEDEIKDYEGEWQAQQEQREWYKVKPAAIVGYEKQWKKANFYYSRGESYGRGKRKSVKDNTGLYTHQRMYRKAESLTDQLCEYLQEQVGMDSSLHIWFDRPLEFGEAWSLGLTPDAMPRVVTSRSLERQSMGMLTHARTKRELKQATLERALEAMAENERLAARTAGQVAADEAAEAERVRQAAALLSLARRR